MTYQEKKNNKPVQKNIWFAVAMILGASVIFWQFMQGGFGSLTSNWSVSSAGSSYMIRGVPKEYSGSRRPVLTVTCGTELSDMRVNFGIPMQNSHSGTGFDFITVDLQFDDEKVIPLTFTPSEDWNTATVLKYETIGGAAKGVGVTIDNLIFNALGFGKVAPRSDWTASSLARKMMTTQFLQLRGFTRSGETIIGLFELADFQELYAAASPKC